MVLQLLLIGIISILGQVVLLRELSVASFGIELIYILAIGIWLLLTGIGALLGRRRFNPAGHHVAVLFLLLGVILPLDMALVRGIRQLFGGVPGAYLPFHEQIAALFLTLTPTCLLLGLLFQWAAKIYVGKSGRTLAKAYAIESAGGVIGGLAATLFLKFGVQNLNLTFICGMLSLGGVLFYRDFKYNASLRIVAVILLSALGLVSTRAPSIDFVLTRWNHPNLAATQDTPYGRITVSSLLGQVSVFENDVLSFESQGTTAEEFAQLSFIHHPDPQQILLLGGGTEGLIGELQKHHPQRIDDVELNRAAYDMVEPFFNDETRRSLNATNVRIHFADPRIFLETTGRYDLIMVAMPEPTSGQSNRFYTREFFQTCRDRLNANGIVTFRLRSAENLWTPQLKQRTASIYRAVKSAFRYVTILPGVTNIFIASNSPLPLNYTAPVERLAASGIETRFITPEYVRYLYTNDRFSEVREILENEAAPINRDDRPICYQYALMIWLSKFFPTLAFAEFKPVVKSEWSMILLGAAFAMVVVIFLFSRRRDMARRSLLVGLAGLVGMVVETVLILDYQTSCGVLYQNIGILLTAFMVGLTIGAWGVNRLAGVGQTFLAVTKFGSPISHRLGYLLIAGFAVCVLFILCAITFISATGLPITAALLVLTGIFVGAIFAYASLGNVSNQKQVVSPLYAADLIGGCIGSVLAALFLIPMLGLDVTLGLMAMLAVTGIVAIRSYNGKSQLKL